MGPKTKKLVSFLNELIPLLEKEENDQWTKWMKRARRLILNSDFAGVEEVIGAYGGMGSFNDLVIGYSYKGNALIKKENYEELNNKLNFLRSEVYELSIQIRKDFDEG